MNLRKATLVWNKIGGPAFLGRTFTNAEVAQRNFNKSIRVNNPFTLFPANGNK